MTSGNYHQWINSEKLEFTNQEFGVIDLTSFKAKSDVGTNNIFTELIFKNCKIIDLNLSCMVIGKKLTLIDCEIGQLNFFATYFWGGFEMKNCIIQEMSNFGAGGYNIDPNEFVIDGCVFCKHLDFFDCYFKGPVKISNNDFRQGTSLGIYLKAPFGIPDNINLIIANNKGQLDTYASNDPLHIG